MPSKLTSVNVLQVSYLIFIHFFTLYCELQRQAHFVRGRSYKASEKLSVLLFGKSAVGGYSIYLEVEQPVRRALPRRYLQLGWGLRGRSWRQCKPIGLWESRGWPEGEGLVGHLVWAPRTAPRISNLLTCFWHKGCGHFKAISTASVSFVLNPQHLFHILAD